MSWSNVQFIEVSHESSVRCFEFYLEGHSEFSESARYLDFISTKWKILSVDAPYKGMSSFQLGKDNNRVEMLLYLKIGIAKVCSKFDGRVVQSRIMQYSRIILE